MGYKEALEAAGAKVLAFEMFGSYQGEWWALVEHDGRRGWVSADYGSCSVCDAFDAEFQDSFSEEAEDQRGRLKLFGEGYLRPQDFMSDEQAMARSTAGEDWYSETREAHEFIKRTIADTANGTHLP